MSSASVDSAPFGVYLHIPFCATRCDYCAFATWTDRHHLQGRYVDACLRELDGACLPPATSVFFGGGTPSLLDESSLTRLLRAVPRAQDAEVTVECNPDTVTTTKLEAYACAGVTRLSFGAQSMREHVLRALGREHDPSSVARAIAYAKLVGFTSWSCDLIFGAARESVDDWCRTLDEVLAFEPPHLSCYALTVEPGTPLARDAARQPHDDDQAEKYAVTDAVLRSAGLQWYEVSNWARPGSECRHNRLYWRGGAYRGIGCAAHSFDGERRRWWNIHTPDRYIDAIERGRPVVAGEEELSPNERAHEALVLALRTREGVPADAIADPEALDGLVEFTEDGRRAVLTVRGRLLANEVAARLQVLDYVGGTTST